MNDDLRRKALEFVITEWCETELRTDSALVAIMNSALLEQPKAPTQDTSAERGLTMHDGMLQSLGQATIEMDSCLVTVNDRLGKLENVVNRLSSVELAQALFTAPSEQECENWFKAAGAPSAWQSFYVHYNAFGWPPNAVRGWTGLAAKWLEAIKQSRINPADRESDVKQNGAVPAAEPGHIKSGRMPSNEPKSSDSVDVNSVLIDALKFGCSTIKSIHAFTQAKGLDKSYDSIALRLRDMAVLGRIERVPADANATRSTPISYRLPGIISAPESPKPLPQTQEQPNAPETAPVTEAPKPVPVIEERNPVNVPEKPDIVIDENAKMAERYIRHCIGLPKPTERRVMVGTVRDMTGWKADEADRFVGKTFSRLVRERDNDQRAEIFRSRLRDPDTGGKKFRSAAGEMETSIGGVV